MSQQADVQLLGNTALQETAAQNHYGLIDPVLPADRRTPGPRLPSSPGATAASRKTTPASSARNQDAHHGEVTLVAAGLIEPSPIGAFFSARVFFGSVGEYTSGTLTVPTSPSTEYPLASQGYDPNVEIGYQTSNTSLSDLQTQFPAGDYNFVVNANGGNPEVDLTIPYATPSAYPNTPEVTNYNALNGMNAAKDFTVDLNP